MKWDLQTDWGKRISNTILFNFIIRSLLIANLIIYKFSVIIISPVHVYWELCLWSDNE